MKSLVLCLVSLVVGWFLGASFSVSELAESADAVDPVVVPVAVSESAERIQALTASLAETEAALVAAQSELEAVRAASKRGAAEAEVAEVEEPAISPFMANMQSMAAESAKQRKREEFAKLKMSLNLTPDQVAALETFYEKDAERQSKMMEHVFAGKSTEVIQAESLAMASGVKYHTVSQLLDDILTPEQLAVYEENEAQEDLERQEATAYSELSRLQRQFLLNEAQKDQVFEIFYDKEYTVKHSEWEGLGIDSSGADAYMDSKVIENERLLETLSEVLAEDQLELYRKKLESDLELQRKSMQMFGQGQSTEAEVSETR